MKRNHYQHSLFEDENIELWRDKDVAKFFNMSASWVRVDRHKRRKGEPHVIKVDPIMVGNSPRYIRQEIVEFVCNCKRG